MDARRDPGSPAGIVNRRPEPKRRWATLTKAAEYFDCSTTTMRRYIASGMLPGYYIGDRKSIKVDLNDLDALAVRIPSARRGGQVA